MKQWEVKLFYIYDPPVVDIVYGTSRANALLIAQMNAEARGWPRVSNNHEVKEI